MANVHKLIAIAVILISSTHDLAAQTGPNSTNEALVGGYTEIHGDTALRFIIGNSLQIEPADEDHPLKAQHVLDEDDIYGAAVGKGCPRIPRILTVHGNCGTDDYFHPVRCEPYRVFSKRRSTPTPPKNGSEIGFFVPGGPEDATTRWSEQQPILRGDVTECASSPDPTPKRPSKIPPPGYLEIYGEEAKDLLIGNTQIENSVIREFLVDAHTIYKNFDNTCLIEQQKLTNREDCTFSKKDEKFCDNYRVFMKMKPDLKTGAKIGFFVPSHGNFTFWFQKRDIFRGNISGCKGSKRIR